MISFNYCIYTLCQCFIKNHVSSYLILTIFYWCLQICFKILTYIFLFAFVIGGTVISQGTLLYATSNINSNRSITCFRYQRAEIGSDNITRTERIYDCMLFVESQVYDRCIKQPEGYAHLYPPFLKTELCDTVKTQWVWCAFLIIVTPYFFVFLRCLWYICFRRKRNPECGALLAVSSIFVSLLLS
jgi:hypothetical protein